MTNRHSWWFASASALALVVAALDGGTAFALRSALAESGSDTPALLALVVLVVLRGIAQLGFVASSQLGRETVGVALRHRAVDELLGPHRSRTQTSDTTLELVDLHPRAVAHAQLRSASHAYAAQAIILATVALFIAPLIALCALGILGVAGVLVTYVGSAVQRRAASVPPAQRAFLSDVTRVLTTLPLIRALRLEEQERGRLGDRIEDHARHARAAALLSGIATVLPTVVGGPALAGALLLALALGLDAPTVVALLLVLVRLVLVASTLAGTLSSARASRSAYETTLRARAPQISAVPRHVQRVDPEGPPSFEATDVRVEATLPGPGISFSVAPGEHLGIVGPSGSGKSRAMAALLGIEKPATGEIRIDGRAPEEYFARHALRTGYVGPEPFLVAGSVRENLVLGRHVQADDALLRSALERAAVWSVVEKLPGQLDHVLGEDGAPLSSGERQRVALARALVADPALLFLDEPTAHVDPETEVLMLETIRALRGTTTCVIAAHRGDLVAHCAQIVRLGG